MKEKEKNRILPLPDEIKRVVEKDLPLPKKEQKLDIMTNQDTGISNLIRVREDIESSDKKNTRTINLSQNLNSVEKLNKQKPLNNSNISGELKALMTKENTYSEILLNSSKTNVKNDDSIEKTDKKRFNTQSENDDFNQMEIKKPKMTFEPSQIKKAIDEGLIANWKGPNRNKKENNETSIETNKSNFYQSSMIPLSAKDVVVPIKKEEPAIMQAPQMPYSNRNSSSEAPMFRSREKFSNLKQIAASRMMYPPWMIQGLAG